MLVKELREKSEKDLNEELVALRKEEFSLRMQQATGQLANPSRFKQLRKDVARIHTVLGEKVRASS